MTGFTNRSLGLPGGEPQDDALVPLAHLEAQTGASRSQTLSACRRLGITAAIVRDAGGLSLPFDLVADLRRLLTP